MSSGSEKQHGKTNMNFHLLTRIPLTCRAKTEDLIKDKMKNGASHENQVRINIICSRLREMTGNERKWWQENRSGSCQYKKQAVLLTCTSAAAGQPDWWSHGTELPWGLFPLAPDRAPSTPPGSPLCFLIGQQHKHRDYQDYFKSCQAFRQSTRPWELTVNRQTLHSYIYSQKYRILLFLDSCHNW